LRFEVHAEQKTLFFDLNFQEAVAAFYHVVCVGSLRYPDEAVSFTIWLQRKVIGINVPGDISVFSLPPLQTKLEPINCMGVPVQLYQSTGW
jgi:hypothetical protein